MLTAPSTRVVRKMTAADAAMIAGTMARAFFDDPVVGEWCFADGSRRMRRLGRMFDLFVRRVYLPQGDCYTTDGNVGAALWLPPGTCKLGAVAELRLLARMAPVTGRASLRIMQVMSFIETRHPLDDGAQHAGIDQLRDLGELLAAGAHEEKRVADASAACRPGASGD